ncbi:glycosyl transferase family 1, partial [Staphylococcus nepalensis]
TTQQKQDILAQSDIPEQKIQVIPHFIEPSTLPEQERKNQFVYLGRFSKEKRIDHIVKAFKLFKAKDYETKLKLYGGVSDSQEDELKDLISKEGLSEDVDIESFTNHPQEVFRESRASILASTHEGFGLSMMESINEGCPVLAYDIRYGPNEIIEAGENGYLIPTGDIEALAQAMERIINHPLKHVHTRQSLT